MPPLSDRTWQRTLIALALIVLSVATAAVPHKHALAPTVSLDAHLDFTSITHDHERPCGACARQQGLWFAPAMQHEVAPRAQTALLPSNPSVAEQQGQGANVCLRGPPSATSVC